MLLSQFNGGLCTRLLPHLLQANQSPSCFNVDTSRGSLVPLKRPVNLNRIVKTNICRFKGVWIETSEDRDYVEFQERLFLTNGVDYPQWSPDGNVFYNLGIQPPKKAPDVAPQQILKLTVFEPELEEMSEDYGKLWHASEVGKIPSNEKVLALGGVAPYESFPAERKWEGKWNTKVFVKHKDLEIYACKTFMNVEVASPDTTQVFVAHPRKCKVALSREKAWDTYQQVKIFELAPRASHVHLPEPKNKFSTQDLQNWEAGSKVQYIAVWNRTEDSVKSVEFFELEITPDMLSGQAFYGIKIDKVEGHTLTLYRDGHKVPLIDHEGKYYDGKPATKEKDDTVYDAAESVKYVYTYYSSATGSESSPSEMKSTPIVGDTSVYNVKVLASEDPQVDKIRIYRLGAGYTKFVLVAELDNETQTYQDASTEDDNLTAVMPSVYSMPAPKGLRYLTVFNTMLFGALEDKLYFSQVGNAFMWESLNFIDIETDITGIGVTPNNLFVFTKTKTFAVTGNSPDTLSLYLVSNAVGCVLHKSIKTIANQTLWLSAEGLYSSTGGYIQAISRDVLGDFDFKNPRCAEVKGDIYLLSYQYGTFVLDARYGLAFMQISERFRSLYYNEGSLFGVNEENQLIELFQGEPYSMHYKTPEFTEGAISVLKTYSDVYTYSEGQVELAVYVNGVLALRQNLNEGYTNIKIPQEFTRGYYIQFEVNGTGVLKELEYKAEGRSNGR